MKSLKFFSVVSFVAVLLFSFSSCKKDKESVPGNTVTKNQLLGKWNMIVVLPGSFFEKDLVTLKADGTMEIDLEPDGKADFILLWDAKDNVFTAHWDFNGVSNLWKFNAHIDPITLSITGQKIMGGNNPTTLNFTMEKQ